METSSYLSIEKFEQTINPNRNLSSAWLVGSYEGVNYTIGFVSKPPHIRLEAERKRNGESGIFKKDSSGIHEILPELQKEVGGKIESSEYSDDFNIDVCSIKNPKMQMNPKGVADFARYIKGLGFTGVKIKPILDV